MIFWLYNDYGNKVFSGIKLDPIDALIMDQADALSRKLDLRRLKAFLRGVDEDYQMNHLT